MDKHESREIWKTCHQFTLDVYKLTANYPKEELYSITSQLRMASSLIATNISEAISRDDITEFNKFLTIALGSAAESKYLLVLSRDLNLIDESTFKKFQQKIDTIKSQINSLKN